ncbi:MAG: LysM peptidoglycan-binding domain-containing M23 family metallopeptidase [Leptospiraceae bacterium]|nr:LysM peptidoglycan-binding domain-containing M23 family metallopeptidase [Leptospiraceae bacterium]MCP5500141.1 LysM peptidoglycan-binding domain-containing M23 family metallopeptidase [Leptospiraceae bacterium]
MKFLFHRVLLLLTFSILNSHLFSGELIQLSNLDYKNPILQRLRSEIFHNLKISRKKFPSERDELIPLQFYLYIVGKKDNFFYIMARTGMNLDTLASVNSLSSPHDIYPGMKLLIPNMRGSYLNTGLKKGNKNKDLLSRKYKIPENFILYEPTNSRWFVPGLPPTKLEKSYFYGFGFSKPLIGGRLSSNYGKRKDPFSEKQTFHGGIDLAAKKGTAVYASAEGKVLLAQKKGGYGKLIILSHKLGYESRYGHLSKILVKPGEKIRRGQKIGEVGSTGKSTGPHLHFEVRRNKKREKPVFKKHF